MFLGEMMAPLQMIGGLIVIGSIIMLQLSSWAKGSLKNSFIIIYAEHHILFLALMHPAWLRCESSEYPDIPAFPRLARRALQCLKL